MDVFRKPHPQKGFLAVLVCGIVWLLGIMATQGQAIDFNGWMLIILYAVGVWAVIESNDGKIFPFAIFLLYCFSSNAGQTLTHLLGAEKAVKVAIYMSYPKRLINEMLLVQGLFVFFMIIGYVLLRKKRPEFEEQLHRLHQKERLTIGLEELLLWGLALYVAVTYLQELSQRAIMDYGEYYYESRQGLGTVAQYLYHVVVFAYLFKHMGWKRNVAIGIVVILAIMAIFIGSRSATIPLLVGLVFIYTTHTRKKFKLKLRYILLGMLLLIVFAAFTVLREYPISQISLSLIAEKVTFSPVQALSEILQEMGTSARTTLETMSALESGVVHHEGTILYSVLKGIFPISLLNLLGIDAPTIESLSAWVSDYGAGLYMEGRGWGYSFIAEIFYNYNVWGFVFSLGFGAAIAGLENWMEKCYENKKFYIAAALLYVLGYSVFLARAETTLLATRIRYTVYLLFMRGVFKLFSKKKVRDLG